MPKPPAALANTDDLGSSLHKFAAELIADVQQADTPTKVAAFKALSQFYIATTKLGDKLPQDEDGPGGLPAMRAALKAVGSK